MTDAVQGAGLGFRRELANDLRNHDLAEIDFFEIAPENWIDLGGRFEKTLREFTERFRFTCHGLSLSLGGTDPLDIDLLKRIRTFLDRHQISTYTEHLSWSAFDGQLYDLLPVPFSEEAALWIAERVRVAQDILGRRIGVENSSYYFTVPSSSVSEAEFIRAVVAQSGCFIHLDVNNLYVNSRNMNYDACAFLAALEPETVGYLHVAGHRQEADGWLIDTHGAPVVDPVWQLLEEVFTWLGPRAKMPPTCLERDFNFPAIDSLLSEVAMIQRIYQKVAARTSAKQRPGPWASGSPQASTSSPNGTRQ